MPLISKRQANRGQSTKKCGAGGPFNAGAAKLPVLALLV